VLDFLLIFAIILGRDRDVTLDPVPVRRAASFQNGENAASVEARPPTSLEVEKSARHCRSGILAGCMDVFSTTMRCVNRRVLLVCLPGEGFACCTF
jgi:hypothetical protein